MVRSPLLCVGLCTPVFTLELAALPTASTALNTNLGRRLLTKGSYKDAVRAFTRCIKLATSGNFGTGPTTRAAQGVGLGEVLALRASAKTGLMQYAEVHPPWLVCAAGIVTQGCCHSPCLVPRRSRTHRRPWSTTTHGLTAWWFAVTPSCWPGGLKKLHATSRWPCNCEAMS